MKKISFLLSCLSICAVSFAQMDEPELTPIEKLQQQTESLESSVKSLGKLKISGYIQTQWQYGQEKASAKVGTANDNDSTSFNRFGIRRGRIKFAYASGLTSGVVQLDITEKGVSFKDVYLNIQDAWVGTNSLQAGIFDRPFGYEISYSSSRRESPERSTVFQTLFPDERDLGAMITLQAGKTSPWNFLKFQGGLFAGNGIKQDNDNRKDFIGHLSAGNTIGDDMSYGIGVSYYNGGVKQATENVYTMDGAGFKLNNDAANKGKYAKREYFGVDGQYIINSVIGMTQVRAEYLMGTQPGTSSSNKSPNASAAATGDTYIRSFNGGYAMLVQDLGTLPFSIVAKYDWYNPNTSVTKGDIGLLGSGTGKADVAYNTLGLGLLWRASNSIRVQAYYEKVSNEYTSNFISGFDTDVKDDLFTLRLQYKF